MKRLRLPVLLAAVAALISCGEPPTVTPRVPEPQPQVGRFRVVLTTPRTDDGALILEIRGPAISEFSAADSTFWFMVQPLSFSKFRVVVTGEITTGALLSFWVPDVGAIDSYSATLLEVAGRDDALRPDLSGYALSVIR